MGSMYDDMNDDGMVKTVVTTNVKIPAEAPAKKKKTKVWLIVLIVALVLIVAGGGIAIFVGYQIKKHVENSGMMANAITLVNGVVSDNVTEMLEEYTKSTMESVQADSEFVVEGTETTVVETSYDVIRKQDFAVTGHYTDSESEHWIFTYRLIIGDDDSTGKIILATITEPDGSLDTITELIWTTEN